MFNLKIFNIKYLSFSIKKYSFVIFSVVLSLVFATVFIRTDDIYNGMQTTWYFYFITITSIILIVVAINLIKINQVEKIKISFNLVDLFVILFLIYSFVRLLFSPYETLNNQQFLILLFITSLYFVWKEFLIRIFKKEITSSSLLILLSAFLLMGLAEAILGIFQLYDLSPGYVNSFFKVNGTFVNPDHFAGYLASLIPFSLGIYKYTNAKEDKEKFLKYLALITFLTCLFILPSLKIRSSWIAVITGIGVIYIYHYEIKEKINKAFNNFVKKGIAILIVIIFFIFIVSLLYQIKPASADGRLLIWKISSEMVKENLILGIGFDRYATGYGNYQAKYFNDNKGNDYEKFLSGNVKQAHNEYLQILAELGIVGLILWLGIICSAIFGYKINDLPPPNKDITYALKISAMASLISLLIISIFSFPLHILPTYINFIFIISILSAISIHKIIEFEIPNILKKVFSFIVLILFTLILINNLKLYNAYKIWEEAYELASYHQYDESLEKFSEAYPFLKTEGEFLFNYSGVLMLNNEYKNAVFYLEESKKNYLDPKQYINLGICYENLNEFHKAEESFKYAANMEPNTIYPRYLLTKLYMKEKKYEQAENECKKIMNMKVKVETTAAKQMKEEVKSLLVLLNNPAQGGNQ